MGSRARAKCISQRSRAWVGGGAREDKASTTLKPFAEQYRTSGPETVRPQCCACSVSPVSPSHHRLSLPLQSPIRVRPATLSVWLFRVARKFSLPRAMQFQINYASGCPWRAVGRRIILRQFTPPRPKEAANKPASISRHAIRLPAHSTHGVRN